MTVCAEVILAGLILNDFKTALYHPGWKWLITNYLSVYSWHLYVTTSWAFSEVSFCTKVALIYPIAFHCAVWRWGGAWDSACLRVTDLHVVHHCMVWIQQLPMQGFTLVSCCIGKLGIFLTKSNQVATSLRVPPNPSCQKDVETHGLSPFPTKRKWIYKQALTNRLRSLQRILFRLLRWNRNLGLPIHTLVLYFFKHYVLFPLNRYKLYKKPKNVSSNTRLRICKEVVEHPRWNVIADSEQEFELTGLISQENDLATTLPPLLR